MITDKTILEATLPSDIFNEVDLKTQYYILLKKYHPDIYHGHNANDIITKINLLYKDALEWETQHYWETKDYIKITSLDNHTYKFKFRIRKNFELGEFFISDTTVIYKIKNSFKMFYDNAIKNINSLHYYNVKMKEERDRVLPNIVKSFETKDNLYLVLKKSPDVFLLSDVLKYFDGNIPDTGAAWITTRLHNICCHLQYNNLCHGAILADSVFISPSMHGAVLLGGWWYSSKLGEKIIGLPKKTIKYIPKALDKKIGDSYIDLSSIRILIKEILGKNYIHNGNSFMKFLNYVPTNDAITTYSEWEKVRDSVFKKQFIEMNITEKDIYK